MPNICDTHALDRFRSDESERVLFICEQNQSVVENKRIYSILQNWDWVSTMTDSIICPNCKTSLRKGSTFCLKCGSPLNGPEETPEVPTTDEATLPEMEDWSELPNDTDDLMAATVAAVTESESLMAEETPDQPEPELPPADDLSWEEGIVTPDVPVEIEEDVVLEE